MTYIINHTTYFFGFIGNKSNAPCWDYFFRACGVIRSEWAWAENHRQFPWGTDGRTNYPPAVWPHHPFIDDLPCGDNVGRTIYVHCLLLCCLIKVIKRINCYKFGTSPERGQSQNAYTRSQIAPPPQIRNSSTLFRACALAVGTIWERGQSQNATPDVLPQWSL